MSFYIFFRIETALDGLLNYATDSERKLSEGVRKMIKQFVSFLILNLIKKQIMMMKEVRTK